MTSQEVEYDLIRSTETPIELSGGTLRVELSMFEDAESLDLDTPNKLYLTVEGITSKSNPGITYAVYLNLPKHVDVDATSESEPYHAGNVSFYGIELAGQLGMSCSFDITQRVSEMREDDHQDLSHISVTFAPLRRGHHRRGTSPEVGGSPVTLRRVAIYCASSQETLMEQY
jgi:hypothetical protein